ncbi:MAG: RdgB/HAM1 family non-canonical purine NTP pyrophosphatase [Pseudomonadales bacterium]|nr:RdgB/HAM1 family non-canonical purine NTP pyrophosphatase [Pseudomonadales bacterium]
MRVVLASGNAGKLAELRMLLEPRGLDLVNQSDFGLLSAEETAATFVENALLKARHASRHCALPALADDSGLCVDALGGAPGIHSARFAGPDASDADNNLKLQETLGAYRRSATAFYYCVLVLVRHPEDPAPLLATGIWRGQIIRTARGGNGFGYDPYFEPAGSEQTAAELDPATKNRISHRGRAIDTLLQQLKSLQSTLQP